jgi:hypothetical protein
MIAQQHKIMRQVLEVRGCSRDAAQHVQSELRDAYRERLLPLIEAICSELSAPGRIDRVDRLEIDLGELPLETFEAALADSFAPAFRSRLADAIDDAPESDADLELFDHFIRTGTVPWWADVADRDLLPAALERLLGRAPRTLRRTIVAAADGERTLGRIVRACSDRLLDRLAAVLAPRWSTVCPGLGSAVIAILGSWRQGQGESARGERAHAERHLLWEEILRAAIAEDVSAAEAPRVFGAVLRRVARRGQLDYRSLVTELHRGLADASVSVLPSTRAVMEALWRETGGNSLETREVTPASESARAHFLRLLERFDSATALAPDGGLWQRLGAVFDHLPARLQAQAIEAFATLRDDGVATLSSPMIDLLAGVVRAALAQQLLTSDVVERSAARLLQSAPQGMSPAMASELGAKLLDAIGVPASGASTEDRKVDSAARNADAAAASPDGSARAHLLQLLERLAPVSASEADPWTRLSAVFGRLPERLQAQAIATFAAVQDSELPSLSSVMIDTLAALVRAVLAQQLLATDVVERCAARLLQSAPPGMPSAAVSSELGAKLLDVLDAARKPAPSAPKRKARVDHAFSDSDAIYLDNAGLVILWPFLQSFFGRLGLLDEKRFRDETAAQRAAGLLQYVATADEAPPEYLLPLNKVLCGIALDEVFDFGEPIGAEEVEENASRRREEKKRTQQREQERATAGKQPRQIGRAEAERELRALEKSYRKPGANQRSLERKNADLERFQRLLKLAGGTGLEKNQRSGKFDELQRTPAKTAGAPQTKSVAGGAQLPGQELRPGKDSYAQPDYYVWRRHKDGKMERVHVNLKSDQIQMQTPARAQSTAKRYVEQAVRNVRHLAQGEGIVISFAHKPSDEVQAAMNKEFFKAGSPVKEVRYGTSAIRAEDYKPPTQAPTAPKAPPAKGAKPKGGKAGGAKSPGVPTTTPKAPKTPKAPGTKAPGAKSTAPKTSGTKSAPLKGAKPPKAPVGPKTATPKAPATKASGPKAPAPKAAPLSETPAAPAPKSAPLPQAQPQPVAPKTPALQTPTPQPKAAPPQAPAQAPVTKSSPPPLAAPPVRPTSAWKGGLKAGGKAAIWALVFAGLDYYVHRRLAKELEESITMTHNGAMPWAQRLKREDPSKPVYMMVKVESKEYSKFIPLLGWMPEPPVLHMISMAMVREPISPPIVEVQDNRLNPWTPGVTTTITYTELMVE